VLKINGVSSPGYSDLSNLTGNFTLEILNPSSNSAIFFDNNIQGITISPGKITSVDFEGKPLN
jgi:hypothetical protein